MIMIVIELRLKNGENDLGGGGRARSPVHGLERNPLYMQNREAEQISVVWMILGGWDFILF